MIIAAYVFMVLGGLFLALGGFGVFRMPDVLNRIQAGTKATTLGAFSLALGVGLANPDWLVKIILIIVFIAVTNPVGSSVLARAAYKAGEARFEKTAPEGKEGDSNECV
ncbi:MAG: Na+/H+ antiporter subunit G [Clostridiales bacterium]|nr:Na+/H+ antiporter subunit G [Clostridiales bacterium]